VEKTQPTGQIISPKLTLLEEALRDILVESGMPIVTTYQLFNQMRGLYKSGRRLWLRETFPDKKKLDRVRRGLVDLNVLTPDKDFQMGVYRIVDNSDRSAEEIFGIIEPFGYISHLSAMARYGLTDRRSKALQLTLPDAKTGKELWRREFFEKDYTEEERNSLDRSQIISPSPRSGFPEKVRGQEISIKRTSHLGSSQAVRGSLSRIATVGQVFASTLEEPDLCGGMKHVVEVWEEHAETYLNEIIESVTKRPQPIVKVRAGYLLNELLGMQDPRIESWTQYAQRGGSRLLDPSSPFEPTFSEKWMLSLNVN
jgi:predicted transcriptional regulator of viral defense system